MSKMYTAKIRAELLEETEITLEADSKEEAITRAEELGWFEYPEACDIIVLKVEEEE